MIIKNNIEMHEKLNFKNLITHINIQYSYNAYVLYFMTK